MFLPAEEEEEEEDDGGKLAAPHVSLGKLTCGTELLAFFGGGGEADI